MSLLTRDEVARIAELARLGLSPEELELFARQLTSILDYAEQLRDVDTTRVPPTSHPLALTTPLRDDCARPSLPAGDVVASAPEPDRAAGLFKVPRVLGA